MGFFPPKPNAEQHYDYLPTHMRPITLLDNVIMLIPAFVAAGHSSEQATKLAFSAAIKAANLVNDAHGE